MSASAWPYPQRRVIAADPNPEAGEATVDFHLTYEGLLFATASKSRPDHVHDIRRVFHKQLKHLWKVRPDLALWEPSRPPPSFGGHPMPAGFRWETRQDQLAYNFSRIGYRFVPLVTEEMSLWCGIHILFLRQDGPVLQGGDVDGRLKTIFDALAMPRHAEQLAKNEKPGEGEDPFYCLMEDDSLVRQVSVETDVLLQPTGSAPDAHDARLVIAVKIKPSIVTMQNLGFG